MSFFMPNLTKQRVKISFPWSQQRQRCPHLQCANRAQILKRCLFDSKSHCTNQWEPSSAISWIPRRRVFHCCVCPFLRRPCPCQGDGSRGISSSAQTALCQAYRCYPCQMFWNIHTQCRHAEIWSDHPIFAIFLHFEANPWILHTRLLGLHLCPRGKNKFQTHESRDPVLPQGNISFHPRRVFRLFLYHIYQKDCGSRSMERFDRNN